MYRFYILLLMLMFSACVREQTPVVVIIPTSPQVKASLAPTQDFNSVLFTPTAAATSPMGVPTLYRPQDADSPRPPTQYMVRPGDSLSAIANMYGTSVETLVQLNQLPNPDVLSVGQIILLPSMPSVMTNSIQLLPDSRLVRSPGSDSFSVAAFVNTLPGFLRSATDNVADEILTGYEIVERISLEFSVDARLLLSILEYRAQWLSSAMISEERQLYPIQGRPSSDNIDRKGLYRQLAWTANQLNRGYYNWKYGNLSTLEFNDGVRLGIAPDLNPGTVGLQYFFSLDSSYTDWEAAMGLSGILQIYEEYFSDRFLNTTDTPIPTQLTQPELSLPFEAGETWFFTGGPHGGWGSGSAWSAIDFAPPDERSDNGAACYISEHWIIAVSSGVIARSANGSIILDLDGDADESTGWTILYLHVADEDRIAPGTVVQAGDRIGRPSCEGGVSNATHLHIGRRYNGEWLPADCSSCRSFRPPQFVMSGWSVYGILNQEYQGYLVRGAEQRTAEQGRLTVVNRVSW